MPPKKKIAALVKVQLQAGAATPAPPVGTALGPHGVNIMEFCKAYNAATEAMRGNVIPVEITIYEDRVVHVHHQDAAGRRADQEGRRPRRRARSIPHKDKVGRISRDQVREIADHQDARPQRQRHRCRDEDRRGHRPLDGRHRRRLTHLGDADQRRRTWQGRAGPSDHTWHTRQKEPVMQRSKAYRAAAANDRPGQARTRPLEAIKLAKAHAKTKFDATVDVAMRLGVDPRKADQMVRGTVNLPHGTGKTARVLVFANADKAEEARAAGADVVGGDELIDKVNGGWLDFDAVVATPDMMGKVGRLGRVLGPRGLMPNPKTGTVTPDVDQGGQRHQGRQDRVPRRPARQPALHHRQGVVHHRAARRELRGCPRRGPAAQAVQLQGPLPAAR